MSNTGGGLIRGDLAEPNQVVIGVPDLVGRFEVLEVHAASKPCSPDVDLKEIAFQTTGYTGAGLANIINMAALLAAKEQRTAICQNDLLNAVETESMGKVSDSITGLPRVHLYKCVVYLSH
jgi:cell division protease FtsH